MTINASVTDDVLARIEQLAATERRLRAERLDLQRRLRNADALHWRRQHAPMAGIAAIEGVGRIPDADGDIGVPAGRAVDTLAAMRRRGTIDDRQLAAGRQFEETFARAGLDELRAADLHRMPAGRGRQLSTSALEARDEVAAIMRVLGGSTAPIALAVWWVAGVGATLKDFAQREGWAGRPMGEKTAAGLLNGGLSVLAAHYGL